MEIFVDGVASTTGFLSIYCWRHSHLTMELLSTPSYVEIFYDVNAQTMLELSPLVLATQILNNS